MTQIPSQDDLNAVHILLDKAEYEYSARVYLDLCKEFPAECSAIYGQEWQFLFGAAIVGTVLFFLTDKLSENAWNRIFAAIRQLYGQQPGINIANEFTRTIINNVDSDTEYHLGVRILELLQICEQTKKSGILLSKNKRLCERVGIAVFEKSKNFIQLCKPI